MKKALIIFSHILAVIGAYAEVIWSEDFESYLNGTGVGSAGNIGDYPENVSKWSLDVTEASLTATDDYIKTVSGKMEAQDTDGPVVLSTELISISDHINVGISIDISESGDLESSNDYVDFEYRVDSGSWTLIENWNARGAANHTLVGDLPDDGDWVDETITVNGISGATLEIKVSLSNSAADEFIQVDNIEIYGSPDPTSSGIDLSAYQTAEGVVVEFVAYDVESNGTIMLALMGANGENVWQEPVNVMAGPRFFARFLVLELELGQSYNFIVRDEVGKCWEASGVTVEAFCTEMVSASLAGITLSFDSLPGHEYYIQWVSGLGSEWQTVKTITAEGSSTCVVVPYSKGVETSGFYRVQLK